MTADRSAHNRHSIRNPEYDYASAGAYFVTICTRGRECLLHARAVRGIITDVWHALPSWFPTIALDEFVVMPNHVHSIIWLQSSKPVGATHAIDPDTGAAPPVGATHAVARHAVDHGATGDSKTREWLVPPPTTRKPYPRLGDVIGTFKSLVFAVYLEWIEQHEPTRRAKFWQRNYYEHVIRDNEELQAIRRYIMANPAGWQIDRDNPSNMRHAAAPTRIEDYLGEIGHSG